MDFERIFRDLVSLYGYVLSQEQALKATGLRKSAFANKVANGEIGGFIKYGSTKQATVRFPARVIAEFICDAMIQPAPKKGDAK